MSLLDWTGLALGAYTAYEGSKASDAQTSAMRDASDISEASLAFQKQMYQHVMDVYGPTEQNLAEYYQRMTPERYETMGLDTYDEQFKLAEQQWSQTMAQRGLAGSGIEAEGLMGMQIQGAKDRASIAQQAPQQWAADQMGWLGLGLDQSGIAQQNIASSSSNLANIYSSQSSVYGQQASAAGSAVGSLFSGAMYANAYSPNTFNPTLSDFTNLWS